MRRAGIYLCLWNQVLGSSVAKDSPVRPVKPSPQALRELYLFPLELVAARRSRNVSQKVLAGRVHVNPSDMSRLERGNRILPRKEMVDAMCTALDLDCAGAARMKWAAMHDRLVAALAGEEMPVATARAVSACLGALRALNETEALGLAAYLADLERSKAVLSRLSDDGKSRGSMSPVQKEAT